MKKLFICIILLYSCGTGHWFVNSTYFTNYQFPIYSLDTNIRIKTEGVYIEENFLLNRNIRKFIYFNKKGYCIQGFFSEQEKNKEANILDYLLKADNIGIYRIDKDSVFIDELVSVPHEMGTQSYRLNGKIKNDKCIHFSFLDIILENRKEIVNAEYQFYSMEGLDTIRLKEAWYSNKKWYKEKLHNERK